MTKLYINHIILSILFTLVFISCKKKQDDPAPVNPTQSSSLKITSLVENTPINFYSSFTTNAGIRYTLSSFRYYISNIRFVKKDGTEFPITGKYFLINPSIEDYDLGQVPVGDYKGIRFALGIDSSTNHKDPTVYPATNPLAIQSPGIHWDWNSGYIFLMIEGSVDTTASNTDSLTYGSYSHDMFFHIGTDMLYRNIDLSTTPFTVSKDNEKQIHIQANVNKLFNSIDLKKENESHSIGSIPLATRVAGNMTTMFTIIP